MGCDKWLRRRLPEQFLTATRKREGTEPHRPLERLARSNRDLTRIHIAFLFAVAIMPFSTTLLAEFITNRVALLEYWAKPHEVQAPPIWSPPSMARSAVEQG